MLPAANANAVAVKPAQPVSMQTAQRTAQPLAPETARTSAGESAASGITVETSKAVNAPEQTAVAPRLRDQETAEQSARPTVGTDAPAGPPPAFEESPLERQARVAFDPPEFPADVDMEATGSKTDAEDDTLIAPSAGTDTADAEASEPLPTPTERAEASFAETRTMSEVREPASVDVSR